MTTFLRNGPLELVIDVFAHLDFRSLLRCRAVRNLTLPYLPTTIIIVLLGLLYLSSPGRPIAQFTVQN
jgi:hypothetical protein